MTLGTGATGIGGDSSMVGISVILIRVSKSRWAIWLQGWPKNEPKEETRPWTARETKKERYVKRQRLRQPKRQWWR
jgi:hypothetical protein